MAFVVSMKSNNYRPERIDAPPLRVSVEALSSILKQKKELKINKKKNILSILYYLGIFNVKF